MKGTMILGIRRCIYATLSLLESVVVFCGGLRRPRVVLLCYHSISSDDWRFSVSEDDFKRQMTWLREQGFDFLTIGQVCEIMEGRKKLQKKAVSIMFDDGYRDILAVKDWLRSKGIAPSVCVLSNSDNASQSEICPGKAFLSTEDIRSLQNDGWAIGSHSATHADFSNLSEDEVRSEIVGSKKQLESVLNEKIDWFVYPKGYYSEMIVRMVREAGYRMAFSMDDGSVNAQSNLFTVSRIGVDRSHSLSDFAGMISPLAILFRKCVKWCIPQTLINRMLGIVSK